jgi:hypothetical protein
MSFKPFNLRHWLTDAILFLIIYGLIVIFRPDLAVIDRFFLGLITSSLSGLFIALLVKKISIINKRLYYYTWYLGGIFAMQFGLIVSTIGSCILCIIIVMLMEDSF